MRILHEFKAGKSPLVITWHIHIFTFFPPSSGREFCVCVCLCPLESGCVWLFWENGLISPQYSWIYYLHECTHESIPDCNLLLLDPDVEAVPRAHLCSLTGNLVLISLRTDDWQVARHGAQMLLSFRPPLSTRTPSDTVTQSENYWKADWI